MTKLTQPREHSLTELCPSIIKYFDPNKNNKINPSEIGGSSRYIATWTCEKGHEWQTSIQYATKTVLKTGAFTCPYCDNRKILKGFNDLATLYPNLIPEWNQNKNTDVTPYDVGPRTSKSVWWKCKNGHEYEKRVSDRIKGGGCPICAGKKVLAGFNDLMTIRPEIAKEWHPTKNKDLKPTQITYGSKQKVWWLCHNGHSYETAPSERKRYGCPYCSHQRVLKGQTDLKTTYPDIASEFHPTKNNGLTAYDIMPNSNKKIWWLGKCGHEWMMTPNDRINNHNNCPYCSGHRILKGFNDLTTTHPDIAKQWHPSRNTTKPTDVSQGSNKKIWWRCDEGHEWQATINDRTNGIGCPYCAAPHHGLNALGKIIAGVYDKVLYVDNNYYEVVKNNKSIIQTYQQLLQTKT